MSSDVSTKNSMPYNFQTQNFTKSMAEVILEYNILKVITHGANEYDQWLSATWLLLPKNFTTSTKAVLLLTVMGLFLHVLVVGQRLVIILSTYAQCSRYTVQALLAVSYWPAYDGHGWCPSIWGHRLSIKQKLMASAPVHYLCIQIRNLPIHIAFFSSVSTSDVSIGQRFLKCSFILELRPYPNLTLTHGYFKSSMGLYSRILWVVVHYSVHIFWLHLL